MMSALPLPSMGPLSADFRPDFRIFTLTLAASLLTGIACGLAPALAGVRADISLAVKEGSQSAPCGYRSFSPRNFLVVAQVAAALMLLLVTGFIVTGYGNLSRIDPGFDTANLAFFSIDPVRDGYSAREAETLFARLSEQLSGAAGVRSVAWRAPHPLAACCPPRPTPASRPRPVRPAAVRFGVRSSSKPSAQITLPLWVYPWWAGTSSTAATSRAKPRRKQPRPP